MPIRSIVTSRRRAVAVALGLALCLGSPGARAAETPDRAAVAEAMQKAQAAHDAGDARGFLEWSRRLARLAPRSTRALYQLARAQALGGDAAAAAATLERLTRMGIATDAARNSDFAGVRGAPELVRALREAKTLDERVGSSEVAFSLPQRELVPTEGIAYDPGTQSFLLSSVRQRKVVRRAPDGRLSDFTRPSDGLLAATGLALDPGRRRLFVSSEGFPQMRGFREQDAGRSRVLEYDLDSGALLRKLAPPAGLKPAELSDLGLAPNGDLFVSDPVTGRVYVLRHGESALSVLVEAGPIGSAQGLAATQDGRYVFVADYVQGIVRVDARTGATLLLPGPQDAALTGIDGLALGPGFLVGIQNGIRPNRVVRLDLAPDLASLSGLHVLERGHPALDEPTLGAFADGWFYFVANSQYGAFRSDGSVSEDALRPPTVLRLRPRP